MPDEEISLRSVDRDDTTTVRRVDWRIEADATELKGTCWRYDESGYEERFDWDLKDVDPE